MGIIKFIVALVAAAAVTALLLHFTGPWAGMAGLLAFFTILRK